jgi:phosphoenolpyruvate synthase/pyruvate phosphate dikinase
VCQIAEHAEFFSFGTNDLTQMTFGYSRDDASKFLPAYLAKGILQNDPFQVITFLCTSCYTTLEEFSQCIVYELSH